MIEDNQKLFHVIYFHLTDTARDTNVICICHKPQDTTSHFFFRSLPLDSIIAATHLARLCQRTRKSWPKSIYTIRIDDRFRLDFFLHFHFFSSQQKI